MMLLRVSLLLIFAVSILLNFLMKSFTNSALSSLFLTKICFFTGMNSSLIMTLTIKGVWSNGKWRSGWILWLLSSVESEHKKNKLMTESELFFLSEYQVETCWMAENNVRSKESAISAIIKMLCMFVSVSLRYFKAEWLLLE